MSTETTFEPGTRVEWSNKSITPNSKTVVHYVGEVIAVDDPRLTELDRDTVEEGKEIVVIDGIGRIRLFSREQLAPYGTADRLRRQRALDDALVAATTARRALEQLGSACSGLPLSSDHDRNDNSEHLAAALSHLRDVSRSLRLNGAQR